MDYKSINKKINDHYLLYVYSLLPFLEQNELVTSAKINSTFKKLISTYHHDWKKELYDLKEKYHLDIDKVDFTLDQAIKNKRMYKKIDYDEKYIKIEKNHKISHIVGACGETWTWSNKESYWSKIKIKDSKFPYSYKLKSVCWFDVISNIPYVQPGLYKLYINHNYERQRYSENYLNTSLTIKAIDQCDKETILYETNFLNDDMRSELDYNINNKKGELLFKMLICDVNTSNLGIVKIVASWMHNDLLWKSGWIYDSLELEEI